MIKTGYHNLVMKSNILVHTIKKKFQQSKVQSSCISGKNLSVSKNHHIYKSNYYKTNHNIKYKNKVIANNKFQAFLRKESNKEPTFYFTTSKTTNSFNDLTSNSVAYVNSANQIDEMWKQTLPENRIECARVGYQKHGFEYNEKRQLSMLNKKLTQKSIEYLIKPINEVRILDLAFPFNSSLEQMNEGTFKPFESHFNFKRTDRLVHENKEWTYFLEERYVGNDNIKGIKNQVYFSEWLNSQGHYYFHNMSTSIQSYINQVVGISQIATMRSKEEKFQALQSENMCTNVGAANNVKKYINKLSDEVLKEIDQKPWVQRLTRSDIQKNKGSCYLLKFNDKFCEQTGSTPTLRQKDDNEHISPWSCILAPNWISFYMSIIYVRLSNCSFNFTRDALQLQNSKGDIIGGYFSYFSEDWIEGDVQFRSNIVVFNQDLPLRNHKSIAC